MKRENTIAFAKAFIIFSVVRVLWRKNRSLIINNSEVWGGTKPRRWQTAVERAEQTWDSSFPLLITDWMLSKALYCAAREGVEPNYWNSFHIWHFMIPWGLILFLIIFKRTNPQNILILIMPFFRGPIRRNKYICNNNLVIYKDV